MKILAAFLCFSLLVSPNLVFGEGPSGPTIVFLGDSLTAGYGLEKEDAYPALVKALFKKNDDREITILNGSVSGSTTSSGLSRLRWFMRSEPDVLFLALGANDGLRGLSVEESKKNLESVIVFAKEAGMKVVLAGMLMPTNYGEDYRQDFEKMYGDLVKKHELIFLPFLLEGVATVRELNQADGIHPNEKGHQVMAETVYKLLKEHL